MHATTRGRSQFSSINQASTQRVISPVVCSGSRPIASGQHQAQGHLPVRQDIVRKLLTSSTSCSRSKPQLSSKTIHIGYAMRTIQQRRRYTKSPSCLQDHFSLTTTWEPSQRPQGLLNLLDKHKDSSTTYASCAKSHAQSHGLHAPRAHTHARAKAASKSPLTRTVAQLWPVQNEVHGPKRDTHSVNHPKRRRSSFQLHPPRRGQPISKQASHHLSSRWIHQGHRRWGESTRRSKATIKGRKRRTTPTKPHTGE